MNSTRNYLEKVKEKQNLNSDWALARFLGITPQAMTKIRKGGSLNDYTALKVAEALGINPLEVIATANREKAKGAEEKAAWERILKSFVFSS